MASLPLLTTTESDPGDISDSVFHEENQIDTFEMNLVHAQEMKFVGLKPPSLSGEFLALGQRSGSTSTPFHSRTVCTSNLTGSRPVITDTTLDDSAISTTFVLSLDSDLTKEKTNLEAISSAADMETAHSSVMPPPAVAPKLSLFKDELLEESTDSEHLVHKVPQMSKVALCGQRVPCTSTSADLSCCDTNMPCSRESYFTCYNVFSSQSTSSVKFPVKRRNSLQDSSMSSLELSSSLCYTQSSADTGYESQLSVDSSHFHSPSDLSSPFNTYLSQFLPKEADRLIGRKIGLDQVDIISELSNRNQLVPLKMLLSYLDPQDLTSMCEVCSSWKMAVEHDSQASAALSQAARPQKTATAEKENYYHKMQERSKLTAPATVLSEVQHVARDSPPSALNYCTPHPLAQHAIDLSHMYWREAERLKNEEALRKCPKCKSPAKMNPAQERARCSNDQCQFDYCVKCHSSFHGSKDCSMTMVKKPHKADPKVGSKKSKKNLRRL